MRVRQPIFLVVDTDLAVLEPDVASVPSIRISIHCHERRFVTNAECVNDWREAGIKPAIAVHHQKLRPQLIERKPQRTAGSEQTRTVVAIDNGNAELPAVADEGFDLFAKVTETENDAMDALPLQQTELVGDEGLASDLNQRFRDLFGQRLQPGRKTARQDRKRRHLGHWTSVLVPSKSNRTRTSSSPTP